MRPSLADAAAEAARGAGGETCGGEGGGEVLALFGYGTFRGDYNESGDRWGLILSTEAKWARACVRGFRLYQDRKRPFPFAVRTGNEEDVLHGTLLTWPGRPESAREAIKTSAKFELPMYDDVCRSVARARSTLDCARPQGGGEGANAGEDEPEVLTYLFHRKVPTEELAKCHCFSSGDWLRPAPALTGNSHDIEVMFAYGRYRGDYNGDVSLGGTWIEALAVGFKLFKDPNEPYPFAVYTGDEGDVLHGTVIAWSGASEAKSALALVNKLENVDEAYPMEGPCLRTVTEVSWPMSRGGHSSLMAFIYYQDWPAEHLSRCQEYPQGDWVRSHVAL